ncbi:hypothetical protein FKR81_07240 [Lentzea tibetensis]|uniref:Uncharacterized protein n=1 Tax=Lentzea tibetensis TaxID=2591470 RepID=A0A563EYV3_9PSEU|nr:hypothetical protein [Lentzea tibetensis]TWP52900.1 hypothetical protein FKR81_07240 [Lentzea tibetensis]
MNNTTGGLGRRRFLAVTGGLAAAATVGFGVPAVAEAQAAKSANGWSVDPKAVAPHVVEGSAASVALRSGEVATVLLHVARRFHYEVAALEAGHLSAAKTTDAPHQTNYLSGTAFAIQPKVYPAGAKGGFLKHQVAAIRDILADCEGVVRWGGDNKKTPQEGHFQIDVKPGSPLLKKVAAKIGGWDLKQGVGAGAPEDLFDATRKFRARTLADKQIATG